MPIRDHQKQARRRTVKRMGERLTVRCYDPDVSEDEYGDRERRETDGSPYDAWGRVNTGTASWGRTRAETNLDADAQIRIRDDVDFRDELTEVEDDAPPTRFERETGEVYQAIRVESNDNGLLAVFAEVVK